MRTKPSNSCVSGVWAVPDKVLLMELQVANRSWGSGQGRHCTSWLYHFTPGSEQLSYAVNGAKMRPRDSPACRPRVLKTQRGSLGTAVSSALFKGFRGYVQKTCAFAKTGLRPWMIHEQKTRLHSSDNLYVNHSFHQLQKKAQIPAGQGCKELPAVGRMPLYLCPVRFSHQAVTSPSLPSTGDACARYHHGHPGCTALTCRFLGCWACCRCFDLSGNGSAHQKPKSSHPKSLGGCWHDGWGDILQFIGMERGFGGICPQTCCITEIKGRGAQTQSTCKSGLFSVLEGSGVSADRQH